RQRAGVRSRKELGPRGGGRWSAGRIRERIGAGTSDKRGGSVWKRFYRSFYRWLCAPEQCHSRRKVRLHLRSALDRCRKQLRAAAKAVEVSLSSTCRAPHLACAIC